MFWLSSSLKEAWKCREALKAASLDSVSQKMLFATCSPILLARTMQIGRTSLHNDMMEIGALPLNARFRHGYNCMYLLSAGPSTLNNSQAPPLPPRSFNHLHDTFILALYALPTT